MTPEQNDDKILTKRIGPAERTTVTISYTTRDAKALRELASSFTLKAGKKASLSLLTRRSLELYSKLMADPTRRRQEVQSLNAMVTTTPAPAQSSKRKAPP